MTNNPVAWFEIYVQDMARAKTFYEAVFQTSLTEMQSPGMEMWTFPMSPDGYGANGTLVKMADVPSGCGGTLVYFKCEDCAVEAARAAEHGGSIFKEKTSIGEYGAIALVFDTEGNMIGLHSCQSE